MASRMRHLLVASPNKAHQRVGATIVGLVLVLVVVLLSGTVASVPAMADGGAPNLAYVVGAGPGGNQLAVIDIGGRKVSWQLTLSGQPHRVLLSPDARTVYVTEPSANRLALIDAAGHSVSESVPVSNAPTAMALDITSSPNILYVTENTGNAVAMVNLESQQVTATIPVGQHPDGVAIAYSGSGITNFNDPEIYVADTGSNAVSVIGLNERHVIATIPTPGGPENVIIPNVGGVAYVTTRSGTVQAIDVAAHRLLGTVLQTPGDALGVMDFDEVTGQIYVPDATANAVQVLAPVTSSPVYANGTTSTAFQVPHEPARILPNQPGAAAVAITFEGAYTFVADRMAGQATMLDAGTNAVLARIAVGGSPQSIITGANPPALGQRTGLIIGMIVLAAIIAMPIYLVVSERRYRRKRQSGQAPGDKAGPPATGSTT